MGGGGSSGGAPSLGGKASQGGGSGQAATGGAPPCTVGADQTCNDNPIVSSLWGRCEGGVCRCGDGREVNPVSGKCRIATEPRITLARTLCFGGCPAYTVALDATGAVTYEGQRYVRVHGAASARIDPLAVRELADEMERAGYFGIDIPEDCELGISTDAPTVTTSLTRGERTHTVVHYRGNNCAPPVLRDLEARIDEVAGTSAWIDCEPNPFCSEP